MPGRCEMASRYSDKVDPVEVDSDRPHLEYSEDMIRSGIWGEEVTAQCGSAVKDTVGKMTGDTKMQAEGKVDKAKGTAHNVAGDLKDAARDATNND